MKVNNINNHNQKHTPRQQKKGKAELMHEYINNKKKTSKKIIHNKKKKTTLKR